MIFVLMALLYFLIGAVVAGLVERFDLLPPEYSLLSVLVWPIVLWFLVFLLIFGCLLRIIDWVSGSK